MDHVAWGALDPMRPSEPGLGIGRWVRLNGKPDTAEFSLTVVDDAQGRGVGTTLLAVLYLSALSLDVRVLRGVVARSNDRMVHWMQRLGATEVPDDDPDDGAISFDLAVSSDPDSLPDTAPARALADAIRRVRAADAANRDTPARHGGRRGRRPGRRRRE